MIDLESRVNTIRYGRERQFALTFFDHDKWVHEPRYFYQSDGPKYLPDFIDADISELEMGESIVKVDDIPSTIAKFKSVRDKLDTDGTQYNIITDEFLNKFYWFNDKDKLQSPDYFLDLSEKDLVKWANDNKITKADIDMLISAQEIFDSVREGSFSLTEFKQLQRPDSTFAQKRIMAHLFAYKLKNLYQNSKYDTDAIHAYLEKTYLKQHLIHLPYFQYLRISLTQVYYRTEQDQLFLCQ
jgi:hypothetical protein